MKWLEGPFDRFLPPESLPWDESWRPVVVVDGVPHRLRESTTSIAGEFGYAVGLRAGDLSHMASRIDVAWLRLLDVRDPEWGHLATLPRLRHLMIAWDPKTPDLEWLDTLPHLQTLRLSDVRAVDDLAPIGNLRRLRALAIEPSFHSRIRVRSLRPLATLDELEEAILILDRIDEGGLRPLAECVALRRLELHVRHATEEYAYLHGRRPEIECETFTPWIPIDIDGMPKDRLVIGKGKPFLDSVQDADRLRKYEIAYERLRAGFADSR